MADAHSARSTKIPTYRRTRVNSSYARSALDDHAIEAAFQAPKAASSPAAASVQPRRAPTGRTPTATARPSAHQITIAAAVRSETEYVPESIASHATPTAVA